VSQGGHERTVQPARHEPMIAQSTGDDSAWDVPEEEELLPEEEYVEEEQFAEEQHAEPSDYQSSGDLNENLPGAESSPFSTGYAPSSTLNDRMAAQAANQTTAWEVGEAPGVAGVQQWSTRGMRSRRGTR